MTMVEKVARALAKNAQECRNEVWSACDKPHLARDPETAADSSWKLFEREARVAIEAMRKPTPKMCKAACKAMAPGKRPTESRVSNSAKHGIRYRAMIDEALRQAAAE